MIQAIIEKAKQIRLLLLDVDGILTPGYLFYGPQGGEYRVFHVHDGLGIKLLQQSGTPVGIITSKRSAAVTQRIKDLNIPYFYAGQEDKLPAYEEIKQQLQLNDVEIAYMGDDLPDLPLLRRVGLAITVPQAPQIIQQYAHWITKRKGGKGAVREVCDMMLKTQGRYQSMIEFYLNR